MLYQYMNQSPEDLPATLGTALTLSGPAWQARAPLLMVGQSILARGRWSDLWPLLLHHLEQSISERHGIARHRDPYTWEKTG